MRKNTQQLNSLGTIEKQTRISDHETTLTYSATSFLGGIIEKALCRDTRTQFALPLLFALVVAPAPIVLYAQQQAVSKAAAPAIRHYLTVTGAGSGRSAYAAALGPRYQKGKERIIMQGMLTTSELSVPFLFARELDDHVRLDIQGSDARHLIASSLQVGTPTYSSQFSDADCALLEMLTDDGPDGFLYGPRNGASVRNLGTNFRVGKEQHADYTGPYYDVFIRQSPVKACPSQPVRHKLYYFDSITKLFVMSRQTVNVGGTPMNIEIDYKGWTAQPGGAMMPQTITRKENGITKYSFAISTLQSAAASSDGMFSTN